MDHYIQYLDANGDPRCGVVTLDDNRIAPLTFRSTYDLAQAAIERAMPLADMARTAFSGGDVDLQQVLRDSRVLLPLTHPDPLHCTVSVTGLTHTGGALARNLMHLAKSPDAAAITDTARMFQLGVDGGKPADGKIGVQPEWCYKGNGLNGVRPGFPLPNPAFALRGGEEPEIAALYLIDPKGVPRRLGFALGNEFSDHVTERQNYLYLGHSKCRPFSYGPLLFNGPFPEDVRGTSRILRDGRILWESGFLSGASNMCHSLANIEHHLFKYAQFCNPGDVHVHYLGTSCLSFADGIETRAGDRFEIACDAFGPPLVNSLQTADALPGIPAAL